MSVRINQRLWACLPLALIGLAIGVGFDCVAFMTGGAGHGSYTPLVLGLGPLALLARFDGLPDVLFWLGPPMLWAAYGALGGAVVRWPRTWPVLVLLAGLHITACIVAL